MVQATKRLGFCLALLTIALGGTGSAKASLVYTLAGQAEATFVYNTSGGIDLLVKNLDTSNPIAETSAISQIVISVGGGLAKPTSLVAINGDTSDFAKNSTGTTPVNATYQGATLNDSHWALDIASKATQFALSTVQKNGFTGIGGKPNHLIFNSASNAVSGNSADQHNPAFVNTVTYSLAFAGLPTSLSTLNITGVSFAFGTDPTSLSSARGTGTSVPPTTPTPEPSTLLGAGLAGLAGLVLARSRRSR